MTEPYTETRQGHPLSAASAYDLAATSYDAWPWQKFWDWNERPLIQALLRKGATPRSALDIGCGTGRYLGVLRSLRMQAIGVDVSRRMLSLAASKYGGAGLADGDVTSLPFPGEIFDVVIAARSLCHVASLGVALREIARVLRVGGRVVVSDLDLEHAFAATRIPSSRGNVLVETWKRSIEDLAREAERAALRIEGVRRIRAGECEWLPPFPQLSSIDRSGVRPIFYLLECSRV